MVGLVLIAHSAKLAEGLLEMVCQIARLEGGVAVAGGAADGSLGTSAEAIRRAIETAWREDGLLVLMDLGSAVLTAELVVEELPPDRQARLRLSNAPLVEGALAAAVQASIGGTLEEVAAAAEAAATIRKVQR